MATEMERRPLTTGVPRDMLPLRTMMDRLLENSLTPAFPWNGLDGSGGPNWDVFDEDNAYHILCYLPGVDPNAVAVSIHENVLTVSGETKPNVPEGWKPLMREHWYGQFRRQFSLGSSLDAGRAEADYADGILHITVPKAEAARPKQITVKSSVMSPRK